MRQLFFLVLAIAVMQAHAKRSVVYVSSFSKGPDGAIHAFTMDDETGVLTPIGRTADMEHPFFMAITPDGDRLFCIDAEQFGGKENEFVAAYAIDRETGDLERINRQSSRGRASCYLEVDATGKNVLVANYSSGNVAVLPVLPDKSLDAATSIIQHAGSSVNPGRQDAPYAHSIIVSPDNRYALAADLGIDKVLVYRFESDEARMSANKAFESVSLPAGSGPRHLTFSPSGDFLYVVNELLNSVTAMAYGNEDGSLKILQTIPTLPTDFDETSHCADLKITPDGKFLFATNRGHDSIAAYRIAADGRLSLIGITASGGKGPQNLLITPSGRWLLCANMASDSLVVFEIDAATGDLSAGPPPISLIKPSCIRWLP